MYGLVNRAIQDMVVANHGEETWSQIKRHAKVDQQAFVSMNAYEDRLTYDLVAAATEVLRIPSATVLEAFGEYWILYSASEGFGALLDMSGSSFVEFLQNLDNLHARVGLSLPALKPPSFRIAELDAQKGRLILHYHSQRSGLAPFVVGLLKGLGKRFETEVEIEFRALRDEGADHDVFLVDFRQA